MLTKLGIIDLQNAVKKQIEDHTKYSVIDAVPKDMPSPFVYTEVVGKEDSSNKTMWKENYELWVHCIAAPGDSRVEVNHMIQDVEEAMTEQVILPEHFQNLRQYENGMMNINQDETDEWHAVLSFSIEVVYGYKFKV